MESLMSQKTTVRNKPRLGRGLSSLISISDLPVEAELPAAAPQAADIISAPPPPPPPPQVRVEVQTRLIHEPMELPLAQVVANPHQPRQTFSEESLAELAASIRSTGLIQPILVRKLAEEQYQLIAGERRYRAAKLAGLSTIPALVRDVDAVTQAQMALIENIQREDLNPIERALGYRTLIDQLGLTQAELAGRLGEDRSSVANFLRLLELAEPVKAMVRDGRLSMGHAKLIAGAPDILEQERLANLVVSQALSVRNLERVMKDAPAPPAAAPAASPAHIQDLEKNLSRQLGLRVQVRAGRKEGRGRLILHYASLDQFDELLSRLGARLEQ
jgi:ParB family transcriptional regulator, chromosome partitioning protein